MTARKPVSNLRMVFVTAVAPVATTPQAPDFLLKTEHVHLLCSEFPPPIPDGFSGKALLGLQPFKSFKETLLQTDIRAPHPPCDAVAYLPRCPEELCFPCAKGPRWLLGAFQKQHGPSETWTFEAESFHQGLSRVPHFPGEGSVLVIQKGQGIRSGHRQSRLPRRNVTENDPQPSKRREPEEAWPPCSRPPSPVGGLAQAHSHGGATRAAGPALCAPSPSHARTAHTQPLPLPLPVTLPNRPESGKPRFWSAGLRGKPGAEDLAKHKRGRSH